jgi:hypothetical protein
VLWLLLIVGFFALFLVMVWRISAGPSNEEPAIGNNLPGPSTEWGQFGLFPTLQGPELGTPESLGDSDPDAKLRRGTHREHFDEERHDVR